MREIKKDAIIIDSQLSENIKIYSRAMVRNSVLYNGVSLGDDTVVVNSDVEEFCEIDRMNYIHNSIIGQFTYTGWNTYIGYTDIGKFCSISRNVDIGGQEHNYKGITTMPIKKIMQMRTGIRPKWEESKRVRVGNDVWIGQGATILAKDGIVIGDGAVIAAGAVVCQDIGSYEIWGGVPARFIKHRFNEDCIDRLIELKWWNLPMDKIEKNIDLFQKEISADVIEKLEELKRE